MKLILSISGGGIRGCIIAEFLNVLEQELGIKVHLLFDMFGGTSTGSLIAAGLAYNKMTGYELNELYNHTNANIIMPQNPRNEVFGLLETVPKYDGKGKRSIINKYLKNTETDKDIVICYYSLTTQQPIVFDSNSDLSIQDAVDMSSSAPAYFPAVKVKSEYGIDGGLFSNNPTDVVYAEALKKYGIDSDIRILSVGCGYQTSQQRELNDYTKIGGIQWVVNGELLSLVMEAPQEMVHSRTKLFTETLGHKYLRINGEIKDSSLDNVSKTNINYLKSVGKMWALKYKEIVNEFLQPKQMESTTSTSTN